MNNKLSLKIESKNYMDCFDVLIYSVANWLGKACEMQYTEAWGFQYDVNEEKLISERIGRGRGDEYKYLEKYHGIIISSFKETSYRELFKKELLQERMPVLIQFDCYWANWMKSTYQNKHIFTHYILATGYDDESEKIFILDNQEANEGLWCSIEELEKGIQKVFCISNSNDYIKRIDDKEILNIMLDRVKQSTLNTKEDMSLEKKLELFIDDMENKFDIAIEVQPYLSNLVECTLLNVIKDVAKGRKKAALVLEHVRKCSGNEGIAIIINALLELSESWNQVFGIFVKYCYMNDNDRIKKKVVSKLKEIKDKEMEVVQLLEEFSGEKNLNDYNIKPYGAIGEIVKNVDEYLFKFICIDTLFNNMGCFNKFTDETRAELSNPKRYLWIEDMSAAGFDIKNILIDKCDNILCEGQLIKVNEKISENSYIMLLMCSEFTNCEVEINLLFEDNITEKIKVGVTSWLYPEPEYNDYIAIEGTPVQRRTEEFANGFSYNFPGHIFGSWYKITNMGKILKHIVLPDCENVHIFAITIAEKKL